MSQDALQDSAPGAVRFAKAGRPRNLRKKGVGGMDEEPEEEEDLVRVRQAIQEVRVKDTHRRGSAALSGGGMANPWANDGFLQWAGPSGRSEHAAKDTDSRSRSTVRPEQEEDELPQDVPEHECLAEAWTGPGEPTKNPEPTPREVWEELDEEMRQLLVKEVWEELDEEMRQLLAAKGLRAEQRAGRGRCIIAKRAFRHGDIILEQDPLAWAFFSHGQQAKQWAEPSSLQAWANRGSDSSQSNTSLAPGANALRCHYCLRTHANLRRCASCKYAHYCCAVHQKSDWPTHSTDCARRTKSDHARPPTTMVSLLAQIHDVKHAPDRPKPPPPPPVGCRIKDLDTLAAHYAAQSAERKTGYAQVAMAWAEFMGFSEKSWASSWDTPKVPPDALRYAVFTLCRLGCNSHTITDSDLRAVGIGLYPLAALVNHSCRPSAVQAFSGRRIRIRAASDLKPGDEVTISYLDLADPLRMRRHELQDRYHFTCSCPLCSAPPDALPVHELHKETVTGSAADGRVALNLADAALAAEEGRPSDTSQPVAALLQSQLRAVAACAAALHPQHVRLLRLREAASRLAIQVCVLWSECRGRFRVLDF